MHDAKYYSIPSQCYIKLFEHLCKVKQQIFIQIKSQTTFTQSNDNDKLCYGRNNNTNQNQ